MTPQSTKVAFFTLGCKLNFSETSGISQQFKEQGFEVVGFEEAADIYVINTCSVTEHADRKCKKVVRDALKHNSQARIAVIGCYAQLKPDEIAEIPGVDVVLGAKEKFNLLEHLQNLSETSETQVFKSPIKEVKHFENAYSLGDRTRSFLKVQDGCNYFCSFCTIPLARGRSRSDYIANIVQSAHNIAQGGVKEIVLTGVNIGDFRNDRGETFYDLVRALDEVPGIDRYRISSIEPNLLSNEIIDFVAHSQRFVPHFHMPLQSGSDYLLSKMRRRYRTDLYAERVQRIREQLPEASIGVDVIVGFPGETDEEFAKTYQFLNSLPISYLHVFTYSERDNTPAIRMDGTVPEHKRTERRKELQKLSKQKQQAFYEQFAGDTAEALLEQANKQGFMQGYTKNYLRVSIPFDSKLINTRQQVKLSYIKDDGTFAAECLRPDKPSKKAFQTVKLE
jgi:threonylcarbamoyladenosine tRNA methylthiotransferase MtaB